MTGRVRPVDRALIVGATGVIGDACFRRFACDPQWDTVGVVHRVMPAFASGRLIPFDVSSEDEVSAKLNETEISHLLFAAWDRNANLTVEAKRNRILLERTLDALITNGHPLRHVILFHGGKAYGAHLGPFRTPASEDDPRVAGPLFYYDQEDIVARRGDTDGFTWTVLRPDMVCGSTLGRAHNLAVAIAFYATLCKEREFPLVFPGTDASFGCVFQATDATLLANASLWACHSAAARNQIFNVSNGDTFRWSAMWTSIAEYFEIEAASAGQIDLPSFISDSREAWKSVVHRCGLQETQLAHIVNWQVAQRTLSIEYDIFSNTIKIRQAGFAECSHTANMFARIFQELERRRLIPSPR
jgi:nucleoside-diphosphate-sugar epimerase